ncbi:MAG: DUF3037 domain-containing protein [Flavitalea sp.]
MQDNHLFEYALIRLVPRVEREEFINVGVILYCRQKKYLECKIQLDEKKAHALDPSIDVTEIRENLQSIEKICRAEKDGGPISKLDTASRFRWLTATRSTIIQSSKVHPGLCTDPDKLLEHLFDTMVL